MTLALMLVGGPVAYKSKSQPIITHSSIEAEFMAATDCEKTALYLCSLLEYMGLPQRSVTIIYEDNAAAIEMANAKKPTRIN